MHIYAITFHDPLRGLEFPPFESSRGMEIFITMETFSYANLLHVE